MESHILPHPEHHGGRGSVGEADFAPELRADGAEDFGNPQAGTIETDMSPAHEQKLSRYAVNASAAVDMEVISEKRGGLPTGNTFKSSFQMKPKGPSQRIYLRDAAKQRPGFSTTCRKSLYGCCHLSPSELEVLSLSESTPPVTVATLRELNLDSIMKNVRLRHDANHDKDIHFMPKNDGERGHQKQAEGRRYWKALKIELQLYAGACTNEHQACLKGYLRDFKPRLPEMLKTIKGIAMTLVPERDHDSVEQHFDVSLLVQEIHHGVCDMVTLTTWLAQLLKRHCAPMRDQLADDMVGQVQHGISDGNMDMVVGGLEKLFYLLEAMKLVSSQSSFNVIVDGFANIDVQDVANHQIRSFRTFLVEGTEPFLTGLFKEKLQKDPHKYSTAQSWYLDIPSNSILDVLFNSAIPAAQRPLGTFFTGLLTYLIPNSYSLSPPPFPKTFEYDQSRLLELRGHLHDLLLLGLSHRILDILLHELRRFSPPSFDADDMHPLSAALTHNLTIILRSTGFDWNRALPDLALEIARQAHLLSNAPQSFFDHTYVVATEYLREAILDDSGRVLSACRGWLRTEFTIQVWRCAQSFIDLSALEICERKERLARLVNISRRDGCEQVDDDTEELLDLEELARRVAHVGVLHWRVWAKLIYLKGDEEEGEEEAEMNNECGE
ncbi:MAG: hypothetical protein M1834_006625 [Cirrosporium novae-zelandiae]|nr:MAG: hypothetical protein M1834_006625 [Cirrosporium novae-zelandiae]